ncbi:MAG: hypothetical protein ACD_60C00087G0016 [uncultured bacterium]|nr:MAG: hypothetical protein ACD_60C00087G0016 [uncultured bacterium]
MDTMEVKTWKDVKKTIGTLNYSLAKTINSVRGSDSFKVIQVRYQYAEHIICKGKYRINIEGRNIPYEKKSMPSEIQKILNYHWRTIPFGIITHNSTESYINHTTHIVPFWALFPGKTFALLSVFDKSDFTFLIAGLYSMQSGSRSLITLPKISHQASNQRLANKYNIVKHLSPKNLSDQWYLFKEIAESTEFRTKWYSELTLFSHEFIDGINETLNLRYHLLHDIWEQNAFDRNKFAYEFIWSIFEKELKLSVKHDPVVIQTVKQLMLIAMRQVPAFIPADSNIAAPVSDFIDVLLHCYKIRYHLPVFMRLGPYDGIHPVYYSLQKHTFFHEMTERAIAKLTVSELTRIRNVLLLFVDYVLNNKFEHSLEKTVLLKTLKEVDFDFYHPHGEGHINSDINSIMKDDRRFINLPFDREIKSDLLFPEHSLFFSGCIRIKPKII